MFAKGRLMIGICTVLTVALTYVIGQHNVAELDNRFFYTVGGLMLSEALAGLICMELFKTDKKGIAFVLGNGFIAGGYVLFTLIMLIPYLRGVSATGLLLTQIAGLLVAVICHVLLGMAHSSAGSLEKAQDASMRSKKIFQLELERFKNEHAQLIAENPELSQKIMAIAEDIRHSSESTEASSEVDERIACVFLQLQEASKAEDACEVMDKIKNQLAYRNQMIKISR